MRFLLRFLLIGLSATFLALPLSAPLQACEEYAASAQATPAVVQAASVAAPAAVDLSAEEKKAPKKKVAMKKKKVKVEYMRAAPMPPGAK